MKLTPKILISINLLALLLSACSHFQSSPTVATASPTPDLTVTTAVPITLPVLDALFADQTFKADLKSKLQLTDEQISTLQKASSDEVASLRRANAESSPGDAEASRQRAIDVIRQTIGADKTGQLLDLARERWTKGGEPSESSAAKEAGPTMLKGPNAVPTDTRIVVNIPAFRMDIFKDGSLIKSYKVGIGYPQFPLPQGLRKAEIIIFNPTWTPPDSPWVDSMKVTPGEVIAAGSKENPLGPIKIPIGSPSLIHGGKSPAKIGTFASHGCVGMTNAQVKDFAKTLAQATNTELSEKAIASYLKNPTKTRVVKLAQLVPVELRYETMVIENGRLHIYRDVYDEHTNTEENLRAVLAAQGISFDSLSADEKSQVLDALNAMSTRARKQTSPNSSPSVTSKATNSQGTAAEKKAEREKKLRNQKEAVIDIGALSGKGYPAPVNLDNGQGTSRSIATNKP